MRLLRLDLRPSPVVALSPVHADAAHDFGGGLVFDAFGDGQDAQLVRHAVDRSHHGLRPRAVRGFAHQLGLDLEVAHRQLEHIEIRRVAAAEIVHRELETEVDQRLHQLAHGLGISDELTFGDLDDHGLGLAGHIHRASAAEMLRPVEQLLHIFRSTQEVGGAVDHVLHRRAGLLHALAAARHHLLGHTRIDAVLQAQTVGHVDELPGRNHIAVFRNQPREGFKPHDLPVGQGYQRLIGHADAVVLNGALEGEALQIVLRRLALELLDPVAPAGLGVVERGIALPQQFGGGERAAGLPSGYAETRRQPQFRAAHGHAGMRDQLAQLLRRGVRGLERRIGQQHQKFLAAPARHLVFLAHPGLQQVRDLLQHGVARGVAEAVVDQLEVIEVEQHQRVADAMVSSAIMGALQVFAHATAVEQPGEAVLIGQAVHDFGPIAQLRAVALGLFAHQPIGQREHRQPQRQNGQRRPVGAPEITPDQSARHGHVHQHVVVRQAHPGAQAGNVVRVHPAAEHAGGGAIRRMPRGTGQFSLPLGAVKARQIVRLGRGPAREQVAICAHQRDRHARHGIFRSRHGTPPAFEKVIELHGHRNQQLRLPRGVFHNQAQRNHPAVQHGAVHRLAHLQASCAPRLHDARPDVGHVAEIGQTPLSGQGRGKHLAIGRGQIDRQGLIRPEQGAIALQQRLELIGCSQQFRTRQQIVAKRGHDRFIAVEIGRGGVREKRRFHPQGAAQRDVLPLPVDPGQPGRENQGEPDQTPIAATQSARHGRGALRRKRLGGGKQRGGTRHAAKNLVPVSRTCCAICAGFIGLGAV